MADPTVDEVRGYIAAAMPCEHLEVQGDGRHFFATIVSSEFDGCSRVARQRKVFAVLGERMHEQIHALSMKTFTPAEWASAAEATNRTSH